MTHTVCEVCERAWVFKKDRTVCDVCTKAHTVRGILKDMASTDMDHEFLIDEIAQMIHREGVKLTDAEIRDICDVYHRSHGSDAKSLDESNELYMGIDHVNNMLLDSSGVGLRYV